MGLSRFARCGQWRSNLLPPYANTLLPTSYAIYVTPTHTHPTPIPHPPPHPPHTHPGHPDSAKLFLGPPPMPVGENNWIFFRRQNTFFKALRAAIQNWPKFFFNLFSDQKNFFLGIRILLSYFWAPRLCPWGKKKFGKKKFDVKTRFLKGSAPLFKIGQKKIIFFRTKKTRSLRTLELATRGSLPPGSKGQRVNKKGLTRA